MWALILALVLAVGCGDKKAKEKIIDNGIPAPGPVTDIPGPIPAPQGFVSFEAFESEILADLTGLNSAQQLNARYLTVCDQLNANSLTDLDRRAVEKGINSISSEITIEPGVWIGTNKCTLRIDLRDYGLDSSKWRVIEAYDPLKFESFTDRGILIKQLSQARRPWIHGSNFLETALVNEAYYQLMDIPEDLPSFLNSLGCDLQGDFDEFNEDLFLMGVRQSRIALQKNRMILLTECQNGSFSSTYDTVLENVTSVGRSLSINPFPLEARDNATFAHDAQEFIFVMENGFLGFALFNAAGLRENFAPTNIVTDTSRAPIDPTIRNARSCYSCHANGYIEARDFMAAHVRGNPNFNANQVQKAEAYFGREQGMLAAMRQANARFARNLQVLNINPAIEDPINVLTDKIRKEMVIDQLAGMLFMRADQLRQLLPQSPGALLAIGQILSGGTINFQDLILVKDILIQDLNLFQEALGQ